jgi:hypothetical protein
MCSESFLPNSNMQTRSNRHLDRQFTRAKSQLSLFHGLLLLDGSEGWQFRRPNVGQHHNGRETSLFNKMMSVLESPSSMSASIDVMRFCLFAARDTKRLGKLVTTVSSLQLFRILIMKDLAVVESSVPRKTKQSENGCNGAHTLLNNND